MQYSPLTVTLPARKLATVTNHCFSDSDDCALPSYADHTKSLHIESEHMRLFGGWIRNAFEGKLPSNEATGTNEHYVCK